MEYDIKEVDRLSGTSEAQRAANYRWLAAQGELTKIEAAKLHTDMIRQFRRDHREQPMTAEFVYAMHALAIAKMVWIETSTRRKGANVSTEEFQRVQEFRVERIKARKRKKESPKRELIRVRFFNLIGDLRTKGLSWREISAYLAQHHKIRLAHSYIRETFHDLTEQKDKMGL